jgi:hypothetical protein
MDMGMEKIEQRRSRCEADTAKDTPGEEKKDGETCTM